MVRALGGDGSELDAADSSASVGARLRALREDRQMPLRLVAAHLNLNMPVVEALERDEYGALPEPVFVRGYIRSYARLFDVDAGPLVETYNRASGNDPMDLGPAMAPSPSSRIPRSRESALVATAGGMVLVCLVTLATWWWFEADPAPTEGGSTPSAAPEGQARAIAGGRDGPVPRRAGGSETDRTVDPSAVPAFDPPGRSAQGPQEVHRGQVMPDRARADSGPMESLGGTIPPADIEGRAYRSASMTDGLESRRLLHAAEGNAREEVSGLDRRGAQRPALAPAAAVVTEGGGDAVARSAEASPRAEKSTIELAFIADSWVDIRDAEQERKLVGIMKANTHKTITGNSPFSLVLGNSDGVQVIFDGEPVDHSSYARGNVARFRLAVDPARGAPAGMPRLSTFSGPN